MRHITSSLACLGLASVLFTGCGSSFSPSGVSGDFDLVSVDGEPPEVTEVGFIKLRESGNFLQPIYQTFYEGSFALDPPNTILFSGGGYGGGTFTGTFENGNQITVTEAGTILVFQK